MKFKANKSDMVTALGIATKAVSNKGSMEILKCLLIKADSDGLTITANDLEMGIQTVVECEVSEPGIEAVDAKMFRDIISKMPDKTIDVTVDENRVFTIKCGRTKFNISGQNPDQFTGLPEVVPEQTITVDDSELKYCIQTTIFATDPNGSQKTMTGELFEVENGRLRIAALDGHRLAIRHIDLDDENNADKISAIIPSKALNDISKISMRLGGEVKIGFTENHAIFTMGDTTVTTRLIDGQYFNLEQILNNESSISITVNRQAIISSLERAGLFVKEGDKKPIIINFVGNEMNISINSPIGNMDETIDTEKQGNDVEIGFNPHFMLDALRAIDAETITMYMSGQRNPCYIRDESESYIYIILPVNFTR